MKRLVCITGIILISCVCIGAFFSPSGTAKAETQTNADTTSSVESITYILKAENNRLIVYKKGENTPYLVTETYTNNLPKSDILLLNEGIEIQGEKNLQKTLQDYCS